MEQVSLNGKKTYEYVFEYFSNQILTGELCINDKIPPERDIAEKLGVSRNSIREVMHMLEINGLIECVQGSGNYVRCNPEEFMKTSVNMVMSLLKIHYTEIFYLRVGYEFAALRLATVGSTESEQERMYQILLRMDEVFDPRESAKLDISFHQMLMEMSHNRLLILYESMITSLMDEFIQDFRTRILTDEEKEASLRASHWDVYSAIKNKDFRKGRKALDRHFAIVKREMDQM